MKTLFETILSSTSSGAFKFTPDMLVRLGQSGDGYNSQFDLKKMVADFHIEKTLLASSIVWKALCQLNTGKTKKEAYKAMVHHFIWNGPEDQFFKDIFKDYIINPDDFDFFCYTEEDRGELYIATHEKKGGKGGKTRALFTLNLNKIK